MQIHSDISEIEQSQWQQLVAESSTASFFQTPECYNFYASLSFLEPFVCGVSENTKLVGILCGYVISEGNVLKRFFSRRAIVPGGVLIHPAISDTALRILLTTATKHLIKKAIYLEIRNYNDYSNYRVTFEAVGFSYVPHLNFHVSTPDVETALKQLNTTKRRDIKLSGREGAEWFETKNPDDLKEYYLILRELYRTKIKTPLFPFEFFEKLIQLEQGKLFIVKHKGKVIGGSVCVVLRGRTIYEWFVCGLDGQIKNVLPSTVATWAAIEYAATNGYSWFDMMGAGKPNEGYGVREFKSKFGGELVEHGRSLYICKPRLYGFGKFIVQKIKSKK
jgi:lipid II:glycine glycyltransferase (peptidoglycan interpeptide bridge formation enzyme)